jgi:hypothetical protein
MKNNVTVSLRTELYRISLYNCVSFVITKVYIPLANVLHLMIYSTLCGNQQVSTHIQQVNHSRTFPQCKRPNEYLALLEFR